MAILMEYVNKDDSNIRIGAILGLGIAYAGSQKDEVGIGSCYCVSKFLMFTHVFCVNMVSYVPAKSATIGYIGRPPSNT
jgi:hypothetical protein